MRTPTTDQSLTPRSNSLKKRALGIFKVYGPLNPPAWAVLAGMQPIRSSYSYLLRLHRFGLLNRERHPRGFLIYTISERGLERLRWLSSLENPNPSQISPLENTSWHIDPK
jgi:hypothetical protein